MAVTNFKQLYYKTDDIISKFKPSLTSYFDVFVNGSFGKASNQNINFLAYEAVLPGTSFETGELFGARQGITETYPTKRTYPPVDVSFYVDYEYEVIEFFEQWMGEICPNKGKANSGSSSSFTRFNYPIQKTQNDQNKKYKTEVIITKFERNFKPKEDRLKKGGAVNYPDNRIEYTLLNAYPTNIISIPVSYGQSDLLRTTITFNYDLYRFERTNRNKQGGFQTSKTKFDDTTETNIIGPGGDSGETLGQLNEQVKLINQNIPTTRLDPNPRDVG
jgi:hypothetical protein